MKFFQSNLWRYILSGILFGLSIILRWGTVIEGLLVGGFSGILFGVAMEMFAAKQTKDSKAISESLSKDSTVVFDGPANFFVGMEGVGGWLYLTDNALLFKPHKYNFQADKARRSIPVHAISKVKAHATFGFIKNGLIVTAYDIDFQFVVDNRSTWIRLITLYAPASSSM